MLLTGKATHILPANIRYQRRDQPHFLIAAKNGCTGRRLTTPLYLRHLHRGCTVYCASVYSTSVAVVVCVIPPLVMVIVSV